MIDINITELIVVWKRIQEYITPNFDIDFWENRSIVSYQLEWIMNTLDAVWFKNSSRYINKHIFNSSYNEDILEWNSTSYLTLLKLDEIGKHMLALIDILQAESPESLVFLTFPKRLPLNSLVKKQQNILELWIYEKMQDIAKYDFNEACKCIAYELPTSAAFHLMRTLEYLWKEVAKNEWINVIQHSTFWKFSIELKKNAKKEIQIIGDQLFHISQIYRNPILHPEEIINIEEAQNLLYSSLSIIPSLIKILESHKAITS